MKEILRHPLITDGGRRILRRMQEHSSAPKFNFNCGDRLDKAGLDKVRSFEKKIEASTSKPGLIETRESCMKSAEEWYSQVPFYRRRGAPPAVWEEIPTISREDLRREMWTLVPDDQALDDLIVYYTSGTTGTKLHVLSHPVVSSMFLPSLTQALKSGGVSVDRGPETVAIMQVCSQKRVLTHASVASFLGEAGYVKINLNPSEWKSRNDVSAYIDDLRPQILTGDPISFLELAGHSFSWKPRALVSSAMALFPQTRAFLENRFKAPVLDVYSMNECRFIASSFKNQELEIILPDIFVEILAPDGSTCPDGTTGEIAVTCGRNPFLPLLRYRTGDFASLENVDRRRFLKNFSGRLPVLFHSLDGRVINNIDIIQILKPFAIARFSLHQNRDLSLRLMIDGFDLNEKELKNSFKKIFGKNLIVEFKSFAEGARDAKLREFSSDIGFSNRELNLKY